MNDDARELDATRQGQRPVTRGCTLRLTDDQTRVLREFAHGTKAVRVEDVRKVLRAVLG